MAAAVPPRARTSGAGARAGSSVWARGLCYLAALLVASVVAFFVGMEQGPQCGDPGVTDCDLAALGGLYWGAGAAAVVLLGIAVVEAAIATRRRS